MMLSLVLLLSLVSLTEAGYDLNMVICKSVAMNTTGPDYYVSLQESCDGDTVGSVNFTNNVNTTGWAYLQVTAEPSKSVTEEEAAFAAGWAEGLVSADLMEMHYRNTMEDYCKNDDFCPKLKKFLDSNMEWIISQIKKNDKSDYWKQIKLTLYQLMGLQEAHNGNNAFKDELKIDTMGMLLRQMAEELDDIEQILKRPGAALKAKKEGGRCSALIKPAGDELYFSHDAWSMYSTMLRFLKRYDLSYKTVSGDKIPGSSISMSSYPGVLHSIDDYYLTSAKLAVMETTLGNTNPELWQMVSAEDNVPAWMRTMVSNRLSNSGREWMNTYDQHNSGTYNNQWMVLDYKLFKSTKDLPDKDLFYVLEQIPGLMIYQDLTPVLKSQGYWASYNVPYYPEIYNLSGARHDDDTLYHGWFTFDGAPRAQIFKRDNHKVKDFPTLKALMRYNDFTHDPLAHCNCTPPYSSENSISARNDLNLPNGTYPFVELTHRCHGGIDMKATNHRLAFSSEPPSLQFVAIGGPTFDPTPAFQWSNNLCGEEAKHEGQADLQKFDPIVHQWNNGEDGKMPVE